MITEHVVAATEKTADALVGRLFETSSGMLDVMSVYLGDRLGLYRALHKAGQRPPTTSPRAAGSTSDMPASGWSNRPRPGSSRSTTLRRRRRSVAIDSRTRTSSPG